MLLSQSSLRQTIFLTPVIFGLAHVHHFYEFRLTHTQVPAARALARSLFQLGYTTIFGAYATFLFLRTGSLLAVCAVHAFCNCMGLPQVWGRVEPLPVLVGGDVVGENGGNGGGRGGQQKQGQKKRASILWSVAYYVLLVAGAVLWYRNLWVLSESRNALVPGSAFGKASA
jgi:prenyl protein peptidase